MPTLLYILLSTFLVSLGSLIGIFTLVIRKEKLSPILLFSVSLSTGALLGAAFIHLLPEASEKLPSFTINLLVLFSFVLFFAVEKILHWHHCHKGKCAVHSFGYMNLIGDGIHNFIDGLILSAAYLSDIKLGLATTLAIALHEIPQEISDFGVLLYAGFTTKRALVANFLVAIIAVLGGFIGFFASFFISNIVSYLLPIASGGFLYIAASDLLPELRKEEKINKSLLSFALLLAGILIMYFIR